MADKKRVDFVFISMMAHILGIAILCTYSIGDNFIIKIDNFWGNSVAANARIIPEEKEDTPKFKLSEIKVLPKIINNKELNEDPPRLNWETHFQTTEGVGPSQSSVKQFIPEEKILNSRDILRRNTSITVYAPPTLDGNFVGENKKPNYPLAARKLGYEGTVSLKIEVLIDGIVGKIEISSSSGFDILDKAAINAVKFWRFKPAKLNGNLICSTIIVPIKFKLKDSFDISEKSF